MRQLLLLVAVLAVLFCGCTAHGKHPQRVGVNVVDLFWNMLGTGPRDAEFALRQIATAGERNFTVLRIAASPFYPDELRGTYYANETAYWEAFDRLVAYAKQHGCMLGTDLFWNIGTWADANDCHIGEGMRDPSSKMYREVMRYTETFTSRYGDSGVIAFWEIGNEWSNQADLNLSTAHTVPSKGEPAHRTLADNFSSTDMVNFQKAIVATIRKAETGGPKPISSGNSQPRFDAYHLRQSYHDPGRDWTADTKEQFAEMFELQCECCDMCSMHVYQGKGLLRWGNSNPMDPVTLTAAIPLAKKLKKTVYLGEFGDPDAGPRPYTHHVLKLLPTWDRSVIPLSTVWVWERYRNQNVTESFTLIPGRDDGMINAMVEFNRNYG